VSRDLTGGPKNRAFSQARQIRRETCEVTGEYPCVTGESHQSGTRGRDVC